MSARALILAVLFAAFCLVASAVLHVTQVMDAQIVAALER